MTLEQIARELSKKFSGPIYSAVVVLDRTPQNGTRGVTIWRIEYTRVDTGKRTPEFDGLIRRTANGVTSAL